MSDARIHWMAQLTIAEGSREEFTSRAQETIATVREQEPGALADEWQISEDGRLCHVDEWYADTAAAMAHVTGEAVTITLPRLLEVGELTGLWIYTAIDDPELRQALVGLGAVFMDRWGGFSR